MDEIYIYHHLGLGDHISCHGIVRYYANQYKTVHLFVKQHNYKNVQFMFNDLNNLHLIQGDDKFVQSYLHDNQITNCLIVGFHLWNRQENFEKEFYRIANVPIEEKWNSFYINRNVEKEKEVFNYFELVEGEYIFLHDNHQNKLHIKTEYFKNPELKIIRPERFDFFDYIYILEHAKEIHCMDSSFVCLADQLNLSTEEIYIHRYLRKYPDSIKLYAKKDWKYIV